MNTKFLMPLFCVATILTSCSDSEEEKFSSSLTGVELNVPTTEINVGDSVLLSYNYTPKDLPFEPTVEWTTSNKAIASINKNGVLQGHKSGYVAVNCILTYNTTKISTAEVFTIKDILATGFYFTDEKIYLKTGDKHNLSYVIEPHNSSLTSVRYISTSPEIATVNDNGEIEALAVGETTIKATLYNSDLIATCTVYVTPTEIESITLNNHYLEIKHGDSDQLVAAIFPENATNKTITWKSSNSNIATVTDGTVRAVGIGTCTITASSTDGKSSDYCDVTVVPINVTGIHVYDKTVAVGDIFSLVYDIMPSNATNQNIKIVSDNPDVVEVISDNTLKALNIGTTYVYATTQDGGFTEKAKITVEDAEEWIKANIPNKISFMLNGNLTNNNGIVSYNGEIMIRNKAPKHIVINNVTLYQTISYSDLSIIGQYNLAIECFGDKSLGAYNFNNIYEPYISFDFTYEGVNLSINKRFLDISNQ